MLKLYFNCSLYLKVTSKTDVVYTTKLLDTIIKYNEELLTDTVKEQIYLKLISLNVNSKKI
jgi:hypothetical protein